MSDPIRVVVVDDHRVIRAGLRAMLGEAEGEFLLVGEAAEGAAALCLVAELQPDVVLMDLRMPGMDGIEAIARLRREWPQLGVLILTTYNEDELMIRGLQAGARGYLLKDTSLAALFAAIRTVARGEMLVQPEVMERLLARAARAGDARDHASQPLSGGVTEREREVLTLVARGERTKEVAARLRVSERTITGHLTNIYTKLNVDSRAAAVAEAIRRGIIPHDDAAPT